MKYEKPFYINDHYIGIISDISKEIYKNGAPERI
jgi:hypothetical protein